MNRLVSIALAAVLALASSAHAAEVCGDRQDNDGNGLTDEGCYPQMRTGVCESPLSCTNTGWWSWSTGSLHYDLPADVAPQSPFGPQIGLRRFYTSQYAPPATPSSFNRTPLGPRWQHNYMSWIDRTGTGDIVLHTPQGEDILGIRPDPDLDPPPSPWATIWFTPQAGQHLSIRHTPLTGTYVVRTLDGDEMTYNAAGQLTGVIDSFGNAVEIAWKATPYGSVISTVMDATDTRRLRFNYAANILGTVELQFLVGGAWLTKHMTTYGYTGDALTAVTIGDQLAQTNVYTNGYLTQVNDGGGKRIVAFEYSSARPGAANQIDTTHGSVGLELASTRASCSGKTLLYFTKSNETNCTTDTDCGSGAMCGGKTGPGATGSCFRGARCLTLGSIAGESVVTNVFAIGPGTEACTGACAEVTQYVWNISSQDLGAVQDALGRFTSVDYDTNGKPRRINYADTDSNASNGGSQRTVYLKYDAGRLVEVRRPSVMGNGVSCTASSTTGCAITEYEYVFGSVTRARETGYTLDELGRTVGYDYSTRTAYDSVGRVLSVDGPLSGSFDKQEFAYWTAADPRPHDPMQDGFMSARTTRSTIPTLGSALSWEVNRYDFWGNPTDWTELDGTRSCAKYDASRNYLTEASDEMAGSDCGVVDGSELTVRYTRDSALRLTKQINADGSCTLAEYDSAGRIARTKRSDDCLAGSAADREDYSYDANGQVISINTYDAAGLPTKKMLATYHASGRLSGAPDPVDPSKTTTLTYDERGALADVTRENNLGHTSFGLDPLGQVTLVSRYKTATESDDWTVTHDGNGRQSSVTDPSGQRSTTLRDDLGRVVKRESSDQTSMHVSMTYTATNQVATSLDPLQTRRFTYDADGRLLTVDDAGDCQPGSTENTGPEISNVYDSLGSLSCPSGNECANLKGRLAYSKVRLMCSAALADFSLDQETFYSYDAAGRLVGEYIRGDSPHADQKYVWTKAGQLERITLPSSAVIGWKYGSTANNSDADLPTAMWRTSPETPVIDNIQWNPYGPLRQYNRQDKISGTALRMRFQYDLAYRTTGIVLEGQTTGGPYYRLQLGKDAKGRVTSRDYYPSDPQMAGVFDSYFGYDHQDRVLCETTRAMSTCPSSGGDIKNSHVLAFTGAGDRKTLIRPNAGSDGGATNVFALVAGSHRLESVDQTGGNAPIGLTNYVYDERGSRVSEDNSGTRTGHDKRTYTYDGRGNLVGVRGELPVIGGWHEYYMLSSFDTRNRRVFKAVMDLSTQKQQHWFFYYDPYDQLTEVRYVPDTADLTKFSTYQLFWLDGLLTAYWQTDSPSGATNKRYVEFDEMGRPVRMHAWTTGNSLVTWAINPDAWGMDTVVIGPSIYQPIVFAGQYRDAETASYLDDGTRNRPGLVLNGARTYDPFTGTYLQLDPLVDDSWSPYDYADGNPVGSEDPSGLRTDIPKWVGCGAWSSKENIIDRVACDEQPPPLTEPRYRSGPIGGSGGGAGSGTGGGKPGKAPPRPPNRKAPGKTPQKKPTEVTDASKAWGACYPDDTGPGACDCDLAWMFSSDFPEKYNDARRELLSDISLGKPAETTCARAATIRHIVKKMRNYAEAKRWEREEKE